MTISTPCSYILRQKRRTQIVMIIIVSYDVKRMV